MTQADFARALGVAPTVISRWVNGDITPGLDALDKIAAGLATTTADLLDDGTRYKAPNLPPSLLELLSRASPAQIRLIQGMLEQMVLEEANHHLAKEASSRKKLLAKKR
jgi:transcriptional regulator with XRE-family HTH domain